jgi:hypothetical protein
MSAWDAEQERIRREEQRRLEEEARKAEEERLLAAAAAAWAAGNVEESEAIIAEPIVVTPIILAKETPKMEGGPVYRTIWKFEITDATLIPRQYLTPDEVKIGGVVRALKNQANIPGVRIYSERV